MLLEEMGDEEVLVLLVLVGPEVKIGRFGAALHGNGLRRAFLAGSNSCDKQVAEFELGLDTKEALAAGNQRAVQRERNVTELHKLQDVILLAVVLELNLVGFGGDGQLVSGIVQVEFDFVADFGKQVELDVLVKVELQLLALLYGEQVIVCLCVFYTQF